MNTDMIGKPNFAGLIPTGGGEWVLILIIVLLLFGGSKLPSLARGMGLTIKEFKKAAKDDSPEGEDAAKSSKTEVTDKKR